MSPAPFPIFFVELRVFVVKNRDVPASTGLTWDFLTPIFEILHGAGCFFTTKAKLTKQEPIAPGRAEVRDL